MNAPTPLSSAEETRPRTLPGVRCAEATITSVSTLSPYLCTVPYAFIFVPPYANSAGLLILPVIAEAAATAGLARYTSESTCPIRPAKLRLVVDSALSPAAITPICPPRHGPQVGVDTIAPASINAFVRPSSSICK